MTTKDLARLDMVQKLMIKVYFKSINKMLKTTNSGVHPHDSITETISIELTNSIKSNPQS